jgi:hypothetical protein
MLASACKRRRSMARAGEIHRSPWKLTLVPDYVKPVFTLAGDDRDPGPTPSRALSYWQLRALAAASRAKARV